MKKANRKLSMIETKCIILTKGILHLIECAQLKGFDIIACLITVMCNVIYETSDNKSTELYEKTAEYVKNTLLEGLKEIEKIEKEVNNGQK